MVRLEVSIRAERSEGKGDDVERAKVRRIGEEEDIQ